jgi:predicted ATPase
VRRLERSGEEHESPCVVRDSFQRTRRSRRRRHPYQEDRVDIFQAPFEGLGNREIPAHHLDLWRQAGRIRVAGHHAEPRSRCPQLIDNLATDVPGAADDEDTVHAGPILQGGMRVDHSRGTTAALPSRIDKLRENREVYLSALRRHRAGDEVGVPWSVPVVASLEALEFTTPVTFFVGENGSGKSTVLEGIAAGMRAIAVGSADLDKDDTLQAARQFAAGFRFERRQQPRTKLFFRAEDIFGFTRRMLHTMTDLGRIEEEFRRRFPDGSYGQKLAMGATRGQRRALEGRYGEDPDARSHGEVFLGLLASRLVPGGLYLLDEPEAPLSPRGVLQLIALIKDRVGQSCQFIIATHSPMLLAFPAATIYVFGDGAVMRTPYADVEHVQLMKLFLDNPQRFLKHF